MKENKNKYVVIIRFHYAKDDPRFEWRLAYFKSMVLPRLLNQSFQDFDIAIRCHKHHEEIFKSLSDKIITFQVNNEGAKYKQGPSKKFFYDFCSWEDVINLNKYEVQIGLDSDDLISLDYLEIIKREVDSFSKEKPGENLHICFQCDLFNTLTLKTYPIGQTYTPQMGSAFFALYQPKLDTKDYHFCYEGSHLTLNKLASKSIVIPSGYCWASVHYYNESTGR